MTNGGFKFHLLRSAATTKTHQAAAVSEIPSLFVDCDDRRDGKVQRVATSAAGRMLDSCLISVVATGGGGGGAAAAVSAACMLRQPDKLCSVDLQVALHAVER